MTPNWGMGPPMRRFLSNYFDLLFTKTVEFCVGCVRRFHCEKMCCVFGLLKTCKLYTIVDCTDNIDAHTMLGYVVHDVHKGVNVHIPYPTESDGVTGGCGFHHGRFIMALRKAAQAEPKYGLLRADTLFLSDY